jgi:hypothetical protein
LAAVRRRSSQPGDGRPWIRPRPSCRTNASAVIGSRPAQVPDGLLVRHLPLDDSGLARGRLLGHDDIVRLDVPMDPPELVRARQGLRCRVDPGVSIAQLPARPPTAALEW